MSVCTELGSILPRHSEAARFPPQPRSNVLYVAFPRRIGVVMSVPKRDHHRNLKRKKRKKSYRRHVTLPTVPKSFTLMSCNSYVLFEINIKEKNYNKKTNLKLKLPSGVVSVQTVGQETSLVPLLG